MNWILLREINSDSLNFLLCTLFIFRLNRSFFLILFVGFLLSLLSINLLLLLVLSGFCFFHVASIHESIDVYVFGHDNLGVESSPLITLCLVACLEQSARKVISLSNDEQFFQTCLFPQFIYLCLQFFFFKLGSGGKAETEKEGESECEENGSDDDDCHCPIENTPDSSEHFEFGLPNALHISLDHVLNHAVDMRVRYLELSQL